MMILLLGATQTLCAQSGRNVTVSGRVLDQDELPLPGATIRIQNTTKGTTTDANGRFSLSVEKGTVIEVIYLGYVTQTEKIGDKAQFEFVLKEDTNVLEDVVVIGYGSVKKSDLTG